MAIDDSSNKISHRQKKNEPRGKENRDLWTDLKTKIYCLCFFLLLQVTVVLTVGRKVKRGGSPSRSPRRVEFLAVAHEPTRRQWWGAWRRCATTVPAPRNLPQHCSCRFQKALDFFGFIL
jgi:hypothetical protein